MSIIKGKKEYIVVHGGTEYRFRLKRQAQAFIDIITGAK